MPKGVQNARRTDNFNQMSKEDKVALLSDPEQLARVNAERAPRDRKEAPNLCGAHLSSRSIQAAIEAGKPKESPYCLQNAGFGTDHPGFGYCKFHGGNTPAGKKAGAKAIGRSIIEQYRREAAFGDRRDPLNDITPEEALLEEVRRSVALVRWMEERIQAWEIEDISVLTDPEKGQYHEAMQFRTGLPTLMTESVKGTPYATDVHSWLILYREERAHMVRVSKLAIDAGIAHRMVSIAEQQGQMLAVAIRATLAALALTPEQMQLVPKVVPTILRQVAQAIPPHEITVQGKVILP